MQSSGGVFDVVVDGKLVRKIKGGVVVDLYGVEAFLPGSQIALRQVQNVDSLLGPPGRSTADTRQTVADARLRAAERGLDSNSAMAPAELDRWAPLSPGALSLVDGLLRRGAITARGLDRVRRVARTIADLAGSGLGALH